MARYFFEISYRGTNYSGWQRQPNAITVQEEIETALSKLQRENITIMGCGRTDAGVHASQFYFHTELNNLLDEQQLLYKLNRMTDNRIAFYNLFKVKDHAHARFDAEHRAYEYHLRFNKNPFEIDLSYQWDQSGQPDFETLNKVANLIQHNKAFFPFCKSHTDVDNYNCDIHHAYWEKHNDKWIFFIGANRFLRGMVRLIVGASLLVALKRLTFSQLENSLNKQTRLDQSWSVPAHGLYLCKVNYPYIND